MNFDEIVLSKDELKMLKSLYDHPEQPSENFNQDMLRHFIKNGFIQTNKGNFVIDNSKPLYLLTKKGERYLRYIAKDNFRFWTHQVISIAALIVSILAILLSILSLWLSLQHQ